MALDLLSRHCRHLPQGTRPLTGEALTNYRSALSSRWKVVDGHDLVGTFTFDDFAGALAFTNQVGEVAEAEDHHPEITLSWGKAVVRLWTHSIDGLSENDFILAAKIDQEGS